MKITNQKLILINSVYTFSPQKKKKKKATVFIDDHTAYSKYLSFNIKYNKKKKYPRSELTYEIPIDNSTRLIRHHHSCCGRRRGSRRRSRQFPDDSGLGEGDDDDRHGQNDGRYQQHEPYSRAPNVIAAHAPSAPDAREERARYYWELRLMGAHASIYIYLYRARWFSF